MTRPGSSGTWPVLSVPRTLCAAGAIAALAGELAALGVQRPLLVTDKGVLAAGLVAQLIAAHGDPAAIVIFDGVTENPLFSDVDNGVALYIRQACDGVIALGGGSVIDTAKFIALLATNSGSVADYAGKPNVPHGASAALIVIPTTAGTGSEASHSSGIHPDAKTASVGMSSRHLIPALAILDPVMTVGLPARLTAATGIDALSHCIEGYLSNKDQPLGAAIALDGIARVSAGLRRAFANPQDLDARTEMMLAAFAGGVSIGMGLGPAHAIALACSDQGFHHGVLSGIGLVASLDATALHAPQRMVAINQAFGLPASASLTSAIAALMRELGLPATLAELGYAAADVPKLADFAQRSHFNLFAPFHPDADQYAAMFQKSLAPPVLHATIQPDTKEST
ncbi:iron-containing alcohol dehydrogenase [Glaciimonas sp. PAMC28666]|uniref:iron-containing alcohol dehydrogenase n=1 Tax=Glaciimonas sp. PAMC28666 TaxID=2807626 RepID=UPI0019666DBC|nr:iron-containing alcohol dehydrogenase [Glaciimonas sp. PAMC28666]QRX81737.1 iron-containing alcohol dehydrogenase [Glaciimonas sp. PAMC28666]